MRRDTCRGCVERKDRRVISKETRVRLASFSEDGERGECWAALIDLGGPTDPARVRADRPDRPTIKLPVNIARPFSILLFHSVSLPLRISSRSISLMSSFIPPHGRAHSSSRVAPFVSLLLALSLVSELAFSSRSLTFWIHPEPGILWIFMRSVI